MIVPADGASAAQIWIQTVAALAGIVLAFVGVLLAWRTAEDQRKNRMFPSDRAAADEFAEATRRLFATTFMRNANDHKAMFTLNQAHARYCENVTDADLSIASYFSEREMEIEFALRECHAGKVPEQQVATGISNALTSMRSVAKDWPYPERRRKVLKMIFERQLDRVTLPQGRRRYRWNEWRIGRKAELAYRHEHPEEWKARRRAKRRRQP